MKLMLVTEKMTAKGWLVDLDRLERHRSEALSRIEYFTEVFLAKAQLPRSALGASGSGSTQKVRDWFWIDCAAPPLVFNKLTKKPQFSTECLIGYAQDFSKEVYGPAAAALYALRKNKKLVEFCETYARFAAHDGRIHFSFNAAGTQTGRWTSSTKMRVVEQDGSRTTYSCNAQQVPKKAPSFDFNDGRGKVKLVSSLRDVFIADPGCVLIQADYEALELRLIAYVYGAQKLIDWIARDVDTHMENAKGIFRELRLPDDARKVSNPSSEIERLANAAREAAKPLAYGVSYQMHDPSGDGRYPTLYKTLKKIFPSLTEQRANTYAERFFELHPEIKQGQSVVRDALAKQGYVTLSLDGRRLYYPDTPRGRNQALNFPMQGTGGALVNRALLELDRRLDWNGQEVRAQVHDELVVQAPYESALEVKGWIEECMALPAQIGETYAGIPATGDVGFDWASCSSRCPVK